ncbi:MAG: iron-containing alcohol dehydrogenase [Pirellulales bacterium]|nr:iron-containing alcohol dehydrogenase [Pirellulales bacterium]
MEISTFRFPTRMHFGPGARRMLAEFAATYNIARPLLVTDDGLARTEAYKLTAHVLDTVWPGAWQPFTGIHPNPLEQDIDDAYEAYRRANCDGIVGLGGGSGLDGAKALRLKVEYPDTKLVDIKLDQLPAKLVPFCAIPTTAGTGSEVGRSSVVTVPSIGRKVVLGGPPMMPELAILDPELTVGLPAHLTAATGMDAMTHAIESYVCPVFHPLCDAIALEAIRLVRLYLPRAVEQPGDLEARGYMLIAASMGAIAFQKDLGAAHSLAHPLSSEFAAHHGLANALVLPTTIRFNGETNSQQYARVAEALGLVPDADPARQVAAWLEELNRSLGITQRLRDLKIPRDALPMLAQKAFEDGCHLTNPRPCTVEDLLRMYEEAW